MKRFVLVSGGTSGIGLETVRALVLAGHDVGVVGRDVGKVGACVEALLERCSGCEVVGFVADLSCQAEVRRLAGEVEARFPSLNVLVNNVGAFFMDYGVTVDGVERSWALNFANVVLLTELLLPLLARNGCARVVNVASKLHEKARCSSLAPLSEDEYGDGVQAYAQSKLALIVWSLQLARRLDPKVVCVNALHPGLVKTSIGLNNGWRFWLFYRWYFWLRGLSCEEGARTSVFLACADEVEGVSGGYFCECLEVGVSELCCELVEGVPFLGA